MIDLFHLIEDAFAIVRKPKGVYVQAKLYHRAGVVYVAYGSGFVRLGQKFGESWGTSHPDIKVLDYGGPGVEPQQDPAYLASRTRRIRAVS